MGPKIPTNVESVAKIHRTGLEKFHLSAIYIRILLSIPFILMILITGLNFRYIGDELPYHIKTIESFARAFPFPNIQNYSSASGPLPYLIWSWVGNIFGFDIWKLRLVSVIATYLAANLFYDLCKRESLPHPIYSSLFLLFFPYLYFHSFTIYTLNITELFGIGALYFYLQDRASIRDIAKGSGFSFLAVYSRQFFLDQPIALLLYEVFQNFQTFRRDLLQTVKQNFWRWLLIGLPILLLLPLFLLWKGVNPPSAQGGFPVQLTLQHLNFFPILIGFYFLPIVIGRKTLALFTKWKTLLAVFIILLPIFFAFPLIYSEDYNFVSAVTGVIAHGVNILGQVFGVWAEALVQFTLWSIGILIILGEILDFPYTESKKKLLFFSAVFLLINLFVPFVFERFYVSVIPYIILLLHKKFNHRILLLVNLGYEIMISLGFAYWQIVLKA